MVEIDFMRDRDGVTLIALKPVDGGGRKLRAAGPNMGPHVHVPIPNGLKVSFDGGDNPKQCETFWEEDCLMYKLSSSIHVTEES